MKKIDKSITVFLFNVYSILFRDLSHRSELGSSFSTNLKLDTPIVNNLKERNNLFIMIRGLCAICNSLLCCVKEINAL